MSKRLIKFICLPLLLLLVLTACKKAPEPTPDPHEGMVLVADGMGGKMWVPLVQELPVSTLRAENFSMDGGYVTYSDESRAALRGIDVSFYQGDIDWERVAADGVEFCIIRAGYRGYSAGSVYEDERFNEYISGALEHGLLVGIYFFSQAVNTDEAVEEARFVLELIRGHDISLPVFFDWENIGNTEDGARTDDVSGETLTDCALAFAGEIERAGYEAGVYFYRRLGYLSYDLSRLGHLTFWAAAAGSASDFYYEHSFWQYSFTGSVDGIEGDVDLNLYFVPTAAETPPQFPE